MKSVKKYLSKKEILIIVAIFLACACMLAATRIFSTQGNEAIVSVNGSEVMRIELSKSEIYNIDANLQVTLEVKDGKIRFINSQCPDHVCEGFGWICEEFEYAICMPAGTVVTISSSQD